MTAPIRRAILPYSGRAAQSRHTWGRHREPPCTQAFEACIEGPSVRADMPIVLAYLGISFAINCIPFAAMDADLSRFHRMRKVGKKSAFSHQNLFGKRRRKIYPLQKIFNLRRRTKVRIRPSLNVTFHLLVKATAFAVFLLIAQRPIF